MFMVVFLVQDPSAMGLPKQDDYVCLVKVFGEVLRL